jgi:hypothetical protein
MGARFIGADRDQVFVMPPSVRDWVPEGHLVWTVLDAVGELDLSALSERLVLREALVVGARSGAGRRSVRGRPALSGCSARARAGRRRHG